MSRALFVALAACAAAAPVRLATMRDQADVLEHASEGTGTVRRSELAAGATIDAEASVPGDHFPMILRGTIGGKLCFTRDADIASAKDGERERIVHRYEGARYAFTFYKTLGDITAQTGWPESSERFEVSVLEGHDMQGRCHATETRTFCREGQREMTVQLCTSMPTLAADAGYLGLALVFDDASQNRLVAWKLAP